MEIFDLQRAMRDTYYERDAKRGREATFRWFVEEVGELARAFRHDDPNELRHEFSDVLAWLSSLANLAGVDLDDVASTRYAHGCPKCGRSPCACEFEP